MRIHHQTSYRCLLVLFILGKTKLGGHLGDAFRNTDQHSDQVEKTCYILLKVVY